MARQYIAPKKYQMKGRKFHGKCEGCGAKKTPGEVFCYVDDVNPAITYNAPYLCRECYMKQYGGKIDG